MLIDDDDDDDDDDDAVHTPDRKEASIFPSPVNVARPPPARRLCARVDSRNEPFAGFALFKGRTALTHVWEHKGAQ